jgi:hypothetical protein
VKKKKVTRRGRKRLLTKAGVVTLRARRDRRNPGEKMIRVVALLFFIGIAAQAECVVYSTACKAGVDWHCYGKADK